MAVVTDSSASVDSVELELEKDFAKSAVASFASRNLFTNGGTASYASFATLASEGGTFASATEFEDFVDSDPRVAGSGTNIEAGLSKGRELLNADSSATASFLILITDGDWNVGADPQVNTHEVLYAGATRNNKGLIYAEERIESHLTALPPSPLLSAKFPLSKLERRVSVVLESFTAACSVGRWRFCENEHVS